MDAVIITVAHTKFREMNLEQIRGLMKSRPVLVDVRGMLDQDEAEKTGMYYRKL
jgi:UDP-N-acetyl-D-mannosaminuronate dehydrogenase